MKSSKLKIQSSKLTSFAKRLIKHPFFAGSLTMLVGTNLHNFGQLVYHFVAGRLLGRAQYADLAAIISILGLVAIVQVTFGLTIVKFVASEKSRTAVMNFAKWVYFWSIWFGLIVASLTLALSPFLIKFLKIAQPSAVYLLVPLLLFVSMTNTCRSLLQGLLRFNSYALSLLFEVGIKLILTFPLIFLGYAVFGAIFALFVGVVFALFIARLSLSSYLKGRRGQMPQIVPLLKFSLPAFVQAIALTSMYSTDLILVKHFFSAEEAGVYASLAKLGSIVFFSASPIASVMFPLVVRRYSHGESYHRIFYLSVLSVSGISGAVLLLYIFFPNLIVGLLYGKEFLVGAPFLWWFGAFMFLLGLATLLIQFYLSIGKTKVVYLFIFTAILQTVLIWFIHPNLLRVIQLSILSAALLVFLLLVYFPYHHRKK